jgi:hypothetical protein
LPFTTSIEKRERCYSFVLSLTPHETISYKGKLYNKIKIYIFYTAVYTNLSDSDPALSEEKFYSEEERVTNCDHYVAEPALQLDSNIMREYALQVALGMRHLEERGITHRSVLTQYLLKTLI